MPIYDTPIVLSRIEDSEANILAAIAVLQNTQGSSEFRAYDYSKLRTNPARNIFKMTEILYRDPAWNYSYNWNTPNINTLANEALTGIVRIGYFNALTYLNCWFNGAWAANPSLKIATIKRKDNNSVVTELTGTNVIAANTTNFSLVTFDTASAYGNEIYLEVADLDANSSNAWLGVSLLNFVTSE